MAAKKPGGRKPDTNSANYKNMQRKKELEALRAAGIVPMSPNGNLGRPCGYTPELGDAICDALSRSTRGLARICEENDGFPGPFAVTSWLVKHPEFAAKYARAKEAQADFMFDQINDIACETNASTMVQRRDSNGNPEVDANGEPVLIKVNVPLGPEVVAHKRLRIDALKWTAGKLRPKLYGEKNIQEHSGPDGGPIPVAAVNWKGLSDEELELAQKLAQKAIGQK